MDTVIATEAIKIGAFDNEISNDMGRSKTKCSRVCQHLHDKVGSHLL